MSINISSNFHLGAGLPLDSRTVVADITARNAIPNVERFDGLIVYCEADSQTYQLQGGVANTNWKILSSYIASTIDGTADTGLTEVVLTVAPTGDTTHFFGGTLTSVFLTSSHDYTDTTEGSFGIRYQAVHNGTGTVALLSGLIGSVQEIGGGTITFAAGVTGQVRVVTTGSVITEAAALWARPFSVTDGSITISYGAKIDPPGAGTTRWTLAVGTGNSYIGGKLSIGKTTAPNAELDVNGDILLNTNPLGKRTDISSTVTFDNTDSWDTGTFTTKEIIAFQHGNMITIKFNIAGTGKGTACLMYLPFTISASGAGYNLIKATEALAEAVGAVEVLASSNTVRFRNAIPGTPWTDAVTRKVQGEVTFAI